MESRTSYNFISELRAKRLYDLFMSLRSTGSYRSFCDITRELEIMPMPIHYISFYMARKYYYAHFVHHRKVSYKFLPKSILVNSFIQNCKRFIDQGETDNNTIIQKAILSESPCIGLSEPQIRRILRNMGCK